jgi:hypothetical protein
LVLEFKVGRISGGCGGFSSYYGPCGATDCSSCHPEGDGESEKAVTTETRTYHIARHVHTQEFGRNIEPGDLYFRVTGFTYEEGGARTGYLTPVKVYVASPPGHKDHDPSMWTAYIKVYGTQCTARNRRRAAKILTNTGVKYAQA